MNPSVVSEEYINLQTAIMSKQQELADKYMDRLAGLVNKEELDPEIPVVPQLKKAPVPADLYNEAMDEMKNVLVSSQPALEGEIAKLSSAMQEEDTFTWIKETVVYNTAYFQSFAHEHNVSDWLPHFLAEQALRPFMQVVARQSRDFINEFEVMGTCPCCGEPHRLAKVEKNGQKFLSCPRCETKWKRRKLSCVHCGEDRPENIFNLNIKEDDSVKIEICETCNNYLKLIDTAKSKEEKSAGLLDLETIHLDFVAQEEGYGDESQR